MTDVLKEDDDHDNDEIIIIDEEEEQKARLKANDAESEDDSDEDERPANNQADDDGDDEREAIRERRRVEKQERKQRREDAIKRDKVELDFLRKRNDDLERRLTAQEQRAYQTDLNGYDTQIAQAQQEVETAERVIAKAVELGNGEDVAKAMRFRDEALQRAQQLSQAKHQVSQQGAPQPPAVDDLTMHYAREFINDNPWYDAQGRDEDSAIVIAIDQSLARDGYNPQTEEYWDELRNRAARRLPERFNSTPKAPQRQARGGPAVGSSKEHAPASTRREISISAERKQALIDAGVWEDPVLRMKYVKRYAEYDKANKA